MIGGQTGGRVGPKGDPGFSGAPGLKGERGPPGKTHTHTHTPKTAKHWKYPNAVFALRLF